MVDKGLGFRAETCQPAVGGAEQNKVPDRRNLSEVLLHNQRPKSPKDPRMTWFY